MKRPKRRPQAQTQTLLEGLTALARGLQGCPSGVPWAGLAGYRPSREPGRAVHGEASQWRTCTQNPTRGHPGGSWLLGAMHHHQQELNPDESGALLQKHRACVCVCIVCACTTGVGLEEAAGR